MFCNFKSSILETEINNADKIKLAKQQILIEGALEYWKENK